MKLTHDVTPCVVNPSTGYLCTVRGMILKAGTTVRFMLNWPRISNAPGQHILVAVEHHGIGPPPSFWIPKSSLSS